MITHLYLAINIYFRLPYEQNCVFLDILLHILCGIHNLNSLKHVRNTQEINIHNIETLLSTLRNSPNYLCDLDPFHRSGLKWV